VLYISRKFVFISFEISSRAFPSYGVFMPGFIILVSGGGAGDRTSKRELFFEAIFSLRRKL